MIQLTGAANALNEMLAAIPPESKRQYDYSFAISDRIDEILKMRNLSKREFARMVGKRPSEISRWLAGTHNFTLATIAKIEITLGTNLINIEH